MKFSRSEMLAWIYEGLGEIACKDEWPYLTDLRNLVDHDGSYDKAVDELIAAASRSINVFLSEGGDYDASFLLSAIAAVQRAREERK